MARAKVIPSDAPKSERKAPTRSIEYEEARLKKEIRVEKTAMQSAKDKFETSDAARRSKIQKLESELSETQARMNPQPELPL